MSRIFLVDDHEIVRRGVLERFEAEDDVDSSARPRHREEPVSTVLATLGLHRRPQAAVFVNQLRQG